MASIWCKMFYVLRKVTIRIIVNILQSANCEVYCVRIHENQPTIFILMLDM